MKKTFFSQDPAYQPYVYQNLRGRFAHWPALSAKAKRTFVIIYGQHATLERIQPIAEAFAQYGDVYAVDTPGFGGMEPSYKIGKYPSLDFMAGHLQYFVTEHIPADRQITFLGISYGFQVVASLLAMDPQIAARSEQALSFVGFVKPSDFDMPLSYKIFLLYFLGYWGRTYIGSRIMKLVVRRPFLGFVYFLARPFNVKYKSLTAEERETYVDQQAWLWMINDHRTHAATGWDLCTKTDLSNLKIHVPGVHIGVPNDHLLRNSKISEELGEIFDSLEVIELNLANHAPLDVDTPDKVSDLLPATLKTMLHSSRNKTAVL